MSQRIFRRFTRRRFMVATGLAPFITSAFAQAVPSGNNHEVMMRNAACGDPNELNVFDPPILKIDIGDSVTFIPFESGHNAASKRGMVPEGVHRGMAVSMSVLPLTSIWTGHTATSAYRITRQGWLALCWSEIMKVTSNKPRRRVTREVLAKPFAHSSNALRTGILNVLRDERSLAEL